MNKLLDIQCGSLLSALNHVQPAIAPKSTLYILEHVLLQIGAVCSLTATDQELTITSSFVPAGLHDDATLLLPFRKLLEVVKSFDKEDTLTIWQHPTSYRYVLECKGSKLLIVGMPPHEYAELPNIETQEKIVSIDISEDHTKILKKATSYCSTEEYRPSMTGVAFDFTQNKCFILATDGFRLLQCTTKHFLPQDQSFIIPARAIDAIVSSSPTIAFLGKAQSNLVLIKAGEQTIVSKLIEAKYPNVHNVIPKDNTLNAVFKRKELVEAVNRAAMFTPSSSPQIVMQFTPKGVTIFAENAESGTAADILVNCKHDIINDKCKEFIIGYNYKYLAGTLNSFPDDEIHFLLKSPTTAVLMNCEKFPDMLALLMPMRVETAYRSLDSYNPPGVVRQTTISDKATTQETPGAPDTNSIKHIVATTLARWQEDKQSVLKDFRGKDKQELRWEFMRALGSEEDKPKNCTVTAFEAFVDTYIAHLTDEPHEQPDTDSDNDNHVTIPTVNYAPLPWEREEEISKEEDDTKEEELGEEELGEEVEAELDAELA